MAPNADDVLTKRQDLRQKQIQQPRPPSVLSGLPVTTPSLSVRLLVPCAESRLNSIIGLKTDKMVLKWKMGRDYWQMNKDLYRANTQAYSRSFFFF